LREAVQGDGADRFVYVRDFSLPNAFLRVPVVVGARNGHFFEIEQGLFPGDEVVTQGAYALAFSGGQSGMSLKEALDAAHGHEHNEDGTEMTAEQRARREQEKSGVHRHDENAVSGAVFNGLLIYSGILSLALLIMIHRQWRNRAGGANHA
jgi:hypothetical protein